MKSRSIDAGVCDTAPSSDFARRRWLVLGILTLVFALNYLDRQVVVILQESIKREFLLSDLQLGLLSGLAFVTLYCTLGIPVAYFAERTNRRNVIMFSLLGWGAMTALCGIAQSFLQLLLARIGVGIGEAGGTPPSHSLLADYFPREQRATALSIYGTGLYLGILLGFLVGGSIAESYGWRTAFIVAAVPALFVAPMLLAWVKEPIRRSCASPAGEGLAAALRSIWSIRAFRYYAIGGALASFTGNALLNFAPSFFIRSYGSPLAEVGAKLGLINGLGGLCGTVIVGILADRKSRIDRRWHLKIAAFTQLACLPGALAAFLLTTESWSLVCYALPASLAAAWVAPMVGITQQVVPARVIALVTAVIFLLSNAIGAGIGPVVVGALSDLLHAEYGVESLRMSLTVAAIGYPIAAGLILIGARLFPKGG